MSKRALARRPLNMGDILAWADAYREATGKWPTCRSGRILQAPFEYWDKVDTALRVGLRGFSGGSSLARLLAEQRGARNIMQPPTLTVEQILQWADEHHERTGTWPNSTSGVILAARGEKWKGIDRALRIGIRGLDGGSSLARLLAEHRGKRHRNQLPALSEDQILEWADDYRQRTGRWPTRLSGQVADIPGQTWYGLNVALSAGLRGLPGGSSLALLLAEQRGVRNTWTRPNLSLEKILIWADGFHARTGNWPQANSGPILEAPGETWHAVSLALYKGSRGLPGGSSLAQLLAAECGVRNRMDLPRLTRKQILSWADAHYRRSGEWPTRRCGSVEEAPEETWLGIDDVLRDGCRGLLGGSSLARLLAQHRGVRNPGGLPPLSKKKILAWADAHFDHTGMWPRKGSGPVADAPGENWKAIDQALRAGLRGLPGGSSLSGLLIRKGRMPRRQLRPPLTEERIFQWAELHFRRTGRWPTQKSGPILDAPGETWTAANNALVHGIRGLPGGSSLPRLIAAYLRHGSAP